MANTADILAAIDLYCEKNHHQVTYLSAKPIIFQLDGEDTYQAELVLSHGRYQSGYYLHCKEIGF